MTWPTFETQDQVPEPFRDMYEEQGGKWVVPDPAADPNALLEAGRKALDQERDARKEAEARAKKVEEKLQDLQHKQGATKHNMTDEELKQFREDVRSDIESRYKHPTDFPEDHPVRQEYERTSGEALALKLDNRVKALAAKNGVESDRLDAWWKLHGERFALTEEDEPMVDGRPGLDPAQFIGSDLKEETPYLYSGTKASGGGGGGDNTSPTGLGTGAETENILKNPAAAVTAAREAGEGS